MNECVNCGRNEGAHGKRVFGTTEKRVCKVAGYECVR